MIPYNTLSEEGLREKLDFDFDLQLFGKGGGKSSAGKILGTLAFGALGFFYGGALFGMGQWGGAIMGASLFSTVWTSSHNPNVDNSTPSVQRFDKAQETMSNTASIPIVYGERKIAGNQTYHAVDADRTQLRKHVVLCECDIEGVVSASANGLLIPTGSQTSNTVFTVQNTMFPDSYVALVGKTLILHCNGCDRQVALKNRDDLEDSEDNFWEYQVSINALVSYINQWHDFGWECFPVANTNMYPGDLRLIGNTNGEGCYKKLVNFETDTVTGGTSYVYYDGWPPDTYKTTGGYTGMCWLDLHFYSSAELNGNPNVECIIRGRRLDDPRTGTHSYSTNPALCVLDFLFHYKYGLGRWITYNDLDIPSFCAAADYCDEVIDFEDSFGNVIRAKRYEMNMVIDQKKPAITWLQDMLANFGGFLVYTQGKLKLMVEKATPVSHKFTDHDIKDISISQLELSETPNEYEVHIIDPKNNWKSIKCKVSDYADQKARGRIVKKVVELDGTTSQYQALRLARFYRDYNLVCSLQVSFTTGMQGMHLEPGDVVTVSYRDAFHDLPIRISEIKETAEHTYEISGRQYNESLYSDVLGGGVQWYTYGKGRAGQGMGGASVPPPITGVVAYTDAQNEILIEHDPSTIPDFKEYRYYVELVE